VHEHGSISGSCRVGRAQIYLEGFEPSRAAEVSMVRLKQNSRKKYMDKVDIMWEGAVIGK
jgi:hypothetical protein